MPIRIEGAGGIIAWGRKAAAVLGPWTYDHGFLSATIRESNPFRLTQSPLVWVIENAGGAKPPTRRRLEELHTDGRTLTAHVGKRA